MCNAEIIDPIFYGLLINDKGPGTSGPAAGVRGRAGLAHEQPEYVRADGAAVRGRVRVPGAGARGRRREAAPLPAAPARLQCEQGQAGLHAPHSARVPQQLRRHA